MSFGLPRLPRRNRELVREVLDLTAACFGSIAVFEPSELHRIVILGPVMCLPTLRGRDLCLSTGDIAQSP